MSCSCIKGNYNFDIEILDTKTLRYTDISTWMDAPPYMVPEYYFISVRSPMKRDGVQVKVRALGSTIITNKDLGLPNCLLDGNYCISAFGCYNCKTGEMGEKRYTRNKFLSPQSDCKIDYLLATSDYDKLSFEKINKLKVFKDHITAVAALGNEKQVDSLYKVFKREMNKHYCPTCNC